jgi:diacylglycerol kinase (ATP)
MPKTAARTQPIPSPSPTAKSSLNFRDGHGFVDGRWGSLAAAWAGLVYTVRTQPNAWIELAALGVVCVAGWWLGITALEWALLALTMTLVLALEAVNTALEAVVDLVSPQLHPLAKIAKDAAAGALVFAVLGSIAVAAAIFGPRLWALLF